MHETAATADVAAILIQLGAAAIVLALLARFGAKTGISPIPFYLAVGLAIGALAPFEVDEAVVEVGSEIGVVLLLFMLGLEYTSVELRTNLKAGLPAGCVDLALNFSPGFLIGLLLGWGLVPALLLGGVTYISSSGIIAKVLSDLDRLGNRETPSILSVLVLEDLAMAVYLPLMAALLVGSTVLGTLGSLAIALGAAAVALIAALRFGDRLSSAISHRSDEVVLLTVFGLILLVAGVADELQVSSAIGAFLVGVALSGSVAERARILLGPLRDLFAATFFVFFGLSIAIEDIPSALGVALALALVTAITKIITGWWAAARAGVGERGRARAGASLVARGEFSIVIAALGVAAGAESELGPLSAAYVLILALAGPLLARYYRVLLPIGGWMARLGPSSRRATDAA